MRNVTRIWLVAVMALAACGVEGGGVRGDDVVQAVAGPGGVTVTARAVGELAVSWSPDPAAVKYYVYQSASGGPLSFVASMLDSSGGPPPTSYIATGLTAGVAYCFAISSAFPDGSESDLSAPVCSGGVGSPRARQISGITVVPEWPGQAGGAGATRIANTWTFATQNWMYFPVQVSVGETISGYQIYVFKGSSSGFSVSSHLIEVDSASGSQSVIGGATTSAAAPGRILLGAKGLSRLVPPGVSYLIRIADGSGAAASGADSFTDATLFVN